GGRDKTTRCLLRAPPLPCHQSDDAKCNGNPRGSIHKMFGLAESRATIDHRNGIVTRAAPRMAPGDPFQPEPTSPQRALCFHGLQKIFRTTRLKSTAGTRAAKQGQQWRES